jgi:hypothetical protein
MSITDSKNRKIELSPPIRMAFHKGKKTITLTKEANGINPSRELYFTIINYQSNTKPATFINSKDDFEFFAKFIGGLKCLKGKFVEENNSCSIWRFTDYTRGEKNFLIPGCIPSFNLKLGSIAFLCTDGLRYQFSTPFIRSESDYDNTLIISTYFFDCTYQKLKNFKISNSKKRIFI